MLKSCGMLWTCALLAALLAGATGAWAGPGPAFPGEGVLAGAERVRVRGCGRDRTLVAAALAVADDGSWRLTVGDQVLGGTTEIVGTPGRRAVLTLDPASMAHLVERVTAAVIARCGETPADAAVEVRKAQIRVKGARRRARIAIVTRLIGARGTAFRGRALHRLVARGPWQGPLTCAEVLECRAACLPGDAVCRAQCVARATAIERAAAVALAGCLTTACPAGGAACEEAARTGDCAAEYEACVGPPPPTDLSCEEILECADGCGSDEFECLEECIARGSTRGEAEARRLFGCLVQVCPALRPACVAPVLAGSCAEELQACDGTPVRMNLSCAQVLACMDTCPLGDGACRDDCLARGTRAAEEQVTALVACIDRACPTRDPRCVADTQTGQCALEWGVCFG